jgi:hypothetical protein
MRKPTKRNAGVASRVQKTAELARVSERYVRMVINGDRENEEVMRIYMFLNEGENKLLKAAKELVPFG